MRSLPTADRDKPAQQRRPSADKINKIMDKNKQKLLSHRVAHDLQATPQATLRPAGARRSLPVDITAFPTQNSPTGLKASLTVSSEALREPLPHSLAPVPLPWLTCSSKRPTLVSPQGLCNHHFVSV